MKMLVKFIMVHLVLVLLGCDWFKQSELPEVTVKNETGVTLENVRLNGESQDIQDGDRHSWQVNDDATMAITFDYNGKTFSTSEKFGKGDTATIHTNTKLSDGEKFGTHIISAIKISNFSGVTLEDVRWNDSDFVDIQNGKTETLEGKDDSNSPIVFKYDGQERTTQESYPKNTDLEINGNTILDGGTKFGDHIIYAPDILIEELTYNKSSSELEGKIRNDGNIAVTEQFFVKFWASDDDSKSSDDRDLNKKSFNEMEKGHSEFFTFSVSLPADFDEGYIIAIIAPEDGIADEKNTNNNKFAYKYNADATPRPIISRSSAELVGTNEVSISVTLDSNGARVTARGVVYSASPNPTREQGQVCEGGEGTGTFTCHLTDLSPSTRYYIRAFAVGDDGSTVYGSEFSVTTLTQGVPDVTVDLSVGSTSVSPGERIKLTATIRNIGNVTADSPRVKYYRSDDSTISQSDIYLGYDNESDLSAGASGTEFEYVYVPSTPGTYYYGAIVDPVSGESNTSNNASSGVRVVVNGIRDLTVDLNVSSTSVSPGERIKLTATIRNIGNVTADSPKVKYYRSDNSTISQSDIYLGYDNESDLSAGASGTEFEYVYVPSTPGTYYYGAIVDPVSGESNTSNNASSGVRVVVNGIRDLTVDLSVSSTSVSPGERIKLTATIRNIGNVTMDSPRVKYYRSDDSTISQSDIYLDYDDVSDLSAGASKAEDEYVYVPSTPGTYYYGAIVDPVSGESNTSNNASSGVKVVVVVVVPIYKITELKFQLIDPSGGDTAELIVEVKENDHKGDTLLYYNQTTKKGKTIDWQSIPATQAPRFWIQLTDQDIWFDDVVTETTGVLKYERTGIRDFEAGGGTGPKVKFWYYVERVN